MKTSGTRHIILVLAVVVAVSLSYQACEAVDFGVRAGLNWSNFELDEIRILGWESLTGFSLGVISRIGLSSRVIFQSELLFTKKGMQSALGHETHPFFYLETPLLLNYRVPVSCETTPFFTVGTSLVYMLDGECLRKFIDEEYIWSNTIRESGQDLEGDRWSLNLVVGMGVEVPLANKMLLLDCRYSHGLDQSEIEWWGAFHETQISSTSVSLGYMF